MLTLIGWWIVLSIIGAIIHGFSKLGSVIADHEEPINRKIEQWLGYDDSDNQ